ncbi:MAG: hypothetical protein NUV49_02345 [Patescibacteria group bacterium]|nr:hypothetical protein [Patescibacteria group bacterium]
MEKELEFNGKIYISSKRGGEITGYTHDYIGQLCRSGKVKGQLVGRTRFVDKESLLAHMEKHESGEERVTPVTFFASNIPPQAAAVSLSNSLAEDTSVRKIPIIKKEQTFSREPIDQKNFPQYASEKRRDLLKNNNISSKRNENKEAMIRQGSSIPTAYVSKTPALFLPELVRHAILFMVIFSLVSGGYGYWKFGITPGSTLVSVSSISSTQNKTLVKEDHRGLVAPYTATFSPGFIPGASLQGAVGLSFFENMSPASTWASLKNKIDTLAVGTYRALNASYAFGKERALGMLWKKETLVFNDTPVLKEPSVTQSGLVVIPPSGDVTFGKEERERIKEHFSDEVIVIPDETGGAGVIQPVFKSGKDEQYSFVLVPVKR